MPGTIVIGGSLAQKPARGGHTWVLLQYLLGFRRLGWDVLLLDRLEPYMCHDAAGRGCSLHESVNLRYLQSVMARFGLDGNFSVSYDHGREVVGLGREEVLSRTKNSPFLLNIMGFVDDDEILAEAPRRVFLDIDPGFGQIWSDLGLHDPFDGHDEFVTIGENVGRHFCKVPTCGREWITTPQPVMLDEWPASAPAGDRFTTIGAWRGSYGTLEHRGRKYGQRVHEFRRFLEMPSLTRQEFEVALDIHPDETGDLARLADNGWRLVDPKVVAADPIAYRSYIQGSKAEFMVAQNMYVEARSGWLSDRSLCYLASGRPVVAQDTGLDGLYALGEGLLTFTTVEEARAAVEDVCRDYGRHARAARALAEDCFDSSKVLQRLLDKLAVA